MMKKTKTIVLEKLTQKSKLGVSFKATDNSTIKVASIVLDSISYKAGLREGDVVKSINGKTFSDDSTEAAAFLRSLKGQIEVEVEVKVHDNEYYEDVMDLFARHDDRHGERSWTGSDLPKFCVQTSVEIRKDPKYVKALLLENLLDCFLYHPDIEATEYKDPSKTTGVGAVRKCTFYKNSSNPEYIYEEIVHVDDERIITCTQKDNRPSMFSYLGTVVKVEDIDELNTRLEYSILYALKAAPLTNILATSVIKENMQKQVYRYGQAVKYHCETGNIATNTIDYPKPYEFAEITNVYDMHLDSPQNKLRDHFEGQTRFGTTASIEIMKPGDEVKKILFDLSTCDRWHPFVEYTEFKGGNVCNKAGAVRKCGFYKELRKEGIPEYVWEEFVDVSDDKSIAFIQEENRPYILDYVGKVFKVEMMDENLTKVTITHTYRPKFLPLTNGMATGPMKEHMGHETYLLCWCLKHYCETGETAKYDMAPDQISFKEVISAYDV